MASVPPINAPLLDGTGHKKRSWRGRGSLRETGPSVLLSIGAFTQIPPLSKVSERAE